MYIEIVPNMELTLVQNCVFTSTYRPRLARNRSI